MTEGEEGYGGVDGEREQGEDEDHEGEGSDAFRVATPSRGDGLQRVEKSWSRATSARVGR
jgi:hypothetical protein